MVTVMLIFDHSENGDEHEDEDDEDYDDDDGDACGHVVPVAVWLTSAMDSP